MDQASSLFLKIMNLVREFTRANHVEERPFARSRLRLPRLRLVDETSLFRTIRLNNDDEAMVAAVSHIRGQASLKAVAFDPDLRVPARLAALSRLKDDYAKALLARTDHDLAVAVQAAYYIEDENVRVIVCEEPTADIIVRIAALNGITSRRILSRLAAYSGHPQVQAVARCKLDRLPSLHD